MADIFKGIKIRAVDSNDDVKKINVWGAVSDADTDFTALEAKINAQVLKHGLKVVGKTLSYIDSNADAIEAGINVPEGEKIVSGDLVIERTDKGPVYFSGKFPSTVGSLDLILTSFITGTRPVGGSALTAVTPNVRTGSKYSK